MQVIELQRDDWNFFCPSTGERVFQESGEPNATTIRGIWFDEVPNEPEALWASPGFQDKSIGVTP
jgi:hypothetical protein